MAKGDSQPNPFTLALHTQRELWDAATESLEKAQVADDRMETIDSVDVGETPSEVVYTENKLELLHYESQTDEQHDVPIVITYALINRPYILDLQPDRSVVRRLLEAGHDVYLIDWNEPSRLDQHLTLDDYVNRYMDNCVDVVRERSGQDSINVLGYCMGGTMSVMYTALHQEKVRTLGLMAAGLCFDETGGVLELWGDQNYYDPEDVTSAFGNMPAEMLDVGFAIMDPVANYVSKYARLYDNLENEDFVENFARMETWLSEGIDVAGDTYVEFLRDIYQENKLHRNEYYLGGEHVDVTSIDVPILQITGEYDHLVPAAASKPFNDVVGSDDVETIEYPTGHIGLAVSGSSHRDVWPRVAQWYLEKSTDDAEDLREVSQAVGEEADVDIETDTTDPAGTEGSDLEEVDGIGPTYAGELADAGVTTMRELAEADPESVAEATDTGVEAAREWVETARDGAESAGVQAELTESETDTDAEEDERDLDEVEESPETDEADSDEADSDEAGTDADETSDLESLEGIGPTYADRLRDVGVTTIEELADADAADVAEAAEVGEGRAREWIDRANER